MKRGCSSISLDWEGLRAKAVISSFCVVVLHDLLYGLQKWRNADRSTRQLADFHRWLPDLSILQIECEHQYHFWWPVSGQQVHPCTTTWTEGCSGPAEPPRILLLGLTFPLCTVSKLSQGKNNYCLVLRIICKEYSSPPDKVAPGIQVWMTHIWRCIDTSRTHGGISVYIPKKKSHLTPLTHGNSYTYKCATFKHLRF